MSVQTIADVDAALLAKLGGRTIAAAPLSGGPLSVECFIEEPHVDGVTARAYPSISIMLIGVVDDLQRREGEPDEIRESLDTSGVPHLAAMRDAGQPYKLLYAIDTWAREFAAHDRALQQIVLTVLGQRTALLLPGTGPAGVDESVWLFKTGFAARNESDGDMMIYHKAFTYEVLVTLADATTTDVALAHQLQLRFSQSASDEVQAEDATQTADLTVTITE